ncbi:adenylate/guanylate cyclase domain-containing protein [Aestuariivirga litoralis]|uniref:adenylate/guanylate cyclase domain-containing protein n=1 Tax=Aestuariivirga litoralis TaxID=2650924 RepID=UPI001FEE0D9D|nr:adenylate/guanylate cyclase domain-containing protein [Aestuariivirga litoralis]
MIEADESAAHELVSRVFRERVEPSMTNAGGSIFKTMGDGILAEFTSLVSAMEWAAQLQQELFDSPLRAPDSLPLRFRIGIVLADVMEEGADRFGEGINLAVRVQARAPPGGMCITKWSHEYLAGKLDLVFDDIGSQPLKNVTKTVRLFVWHPDRRVQQAAVKEAFGAPSQATQDFGRPSLAVLAFENMSTDPEQTHFADAVVEELTATLSRVGDFLVIARNSAFAYKGTNVDVRRIGQDLGVRYLLEGSVRTAGERVRITAQLIEAETGSHIWAGKEEGTRSDLFDLQDRIAEMVAGAVYPSVRRAEIERARKKRPDNLEAYDLVMRALPYLWAHRMYENPVAIQLLDKALKLDPNYGLAAALCAWAHAQQVAYQWTENNGGERLKGLALIERAAASVQDDATGLTALGTAVMLLEGNAARALSFVDRALKLDKNHAWAWMRRGFGLVYVGKPKEALESFARAERLSPLDPFAFNMRVGIGLAHFSLGDLEEAMRFAQMVLDERPGLSWPLRDMAVYKATVGDFETAKRALATFADGRPPMDVASVRDSLKFMHAPLLEKYLAGLRLSGLPETHPPKES